MMMLLALPQPGPRLASAPRAEAAWSSSIEPRPRPEQARAADPQDVAPRDAQLRIAQVFASLSGYDDHRVAPWFPRGRTARRVYIFDRISNIIVSRAC